MFEEYHTYFPDLNYWFNKILNRYSILNRYKIKSPVAQKGDVPRYTFIELLFNDNWDKERNSYFYLYREIPKNFWPNFIIRRLTVYPDTKYFHADDSTNCFNIFELKEDDFLLLNKLLQYRQEENFDLSNIIYTDLTTNLSKMIFLYLKLKKEGDFSFYNNLELISDKKLLENCYEVYLIANYLEFMENRFSF